MKSTEFLNVFEEKGIHTFSFNDAVRISGKKRPYVRLMLNRMVSKNIIQRAERGIYYTKKASPLEIASNIVSPSYVSLGSAFSYYGVTTQIPINIDIVSSKRHKKIDLRGPRQNRIIFSTLKREKMFGFYRDRGNINIAEIEKALVDAIYFKKPGLGQISEAVGVALRERKVSLAKIKEYAHDMGSKATIKRLNLILKNLGANKWAFSITDE